MTSSPNELETITTNFEIKPGDKFISRIANSKIGTNFYESVLHFKDRAIFEGALLAVVIEPIGGPPTMIGSAFVIAPGVAITAKHLLDPLLLESRSPKSFAFCFGVTSEGLQVWQCKHIIPGEIDDVAILTLAPKSQLPDSREYTRFALSAKLPRIGEKVSIVGFKSDALLKNCGRYIIDCDIYVSSGLVEEVFITGRDRILMPYTSYSIICESIGGMSGGAVIDNNGYVAGVISRGISSADSGHITYAASFLSSLTWPISPSWPAGIYRPDTCLYDSPNDIVYINQKDLIERIDNTTFRVRFG